MKVFLMTMTALFLLLMWLFSTSLTVGGKHDFTAFKFKSIFYWVSIIVSFMAGYLIR